MTGAVGWGRRAVLAVVFAVGIAPVAATESDPPVRLDGALAQGALVRGTTTPGARLRFAGKTVRVDPDGRFIIGLGRDAKGPAALEIELPDGARRTAQLPVASREWQVQRIDGLPGAKVNPDAAALERIRAEQKRLDAARAVDSAEAGWRQSFAWPASGPISGVYGSQRILNGEPRTPHVALDIAGPEGAPVQAPADGVVRLAEPDLFFTGQTVILDHGHGVTSLYAHLSAIVVATGQRVVRGEPIGRIGKTGRVTGPHLHFGLFWRGVAVDPAPILPAAQPGAG